MRGGTTLVRACLVLAAAGASALAARGQGPAAGREPVLSQIRVPHPYYYREMYLPQVTSGPSGAAWSPDGRELVFSMQARSGGSAATARSGQLTTGPGYDYQPDWSPDGRSIVYARTATMRWSCGCSTCATGEARPLTSDGAVNLEPRWSPDGRRLAFVSTAHERPLPRLRRWTSGRASRARRRASPRSATAACRATTTAVRPHLIAHLVARRRRAALRLEPRAHAGARAASGGRSAEPGAPLARDPLRGDHLEGAAGLVAGRPARGLRLLPGPPVAPALGNDRRRRRRLPAHLRRVGCDGAPLVA